MSTLKVTNIQATGETASRAVSGVAAAWVFNFAGSGIVNSQNVSSYTDHGVGDYSWGLTNAFVANNQYVQSSISNATANNRTHNRNSARADQATLATEVGNYGTSSAVDDTVNVTAHGDLA